jgi:hypothetical protein
VPLAPSSQSADRRRDARASGFEAHRKLPCSAFVIAFGAFFRVPFQNSPSRLFLKVRVDAINMRKQPAVALDAPSVRCGFLLKTVDFLAKTVKFRSELSNLIALECTDYGVGANGSDAEFHDIEKRSVMGLHPNDEIESHGCLPSPGSALQTSMAFN